MKTGPMLKRKLSDPNCPKVFINRFIALKHRFSKEKLCKTENIDLLLDYSVGDGFNATVMSKDGNFIKSNSNYFKNIILTDNGINKFKQWVTCWDNTISAK